MEMLKNLTTNKNITLGYLGTLNFYKDVVHINQDFTKSVLHNTVFSTTVILVVLVNILVLLRVKMKDKVLIDKMVALDCFSNILMVGLLLLAFPVRIWGNRYLCAGITFYRGFTVTINRSSRTQESALLIVDPIELSCVGAVTN